MQNEDIKVKQVEMERIYKQSNEYVSEI